MLPCGTVLVLGSLQVMAESDPGMVRGLLVITGLVMLGGFTMMFGGLLIVLCRMFVMLVNLVLCHFVLPDFVPHSPRLVTHGTSKVRYAARNNVPGFNKPALNSGRTARLGTGPLAGVDRTAGRTAGK